MDRTKNLPSSKAAMDENSMGKNRAAAITPLLCGELKCGVTVRTVDEITQM